MAFPSTPLVVTLKAAFGASRSADPSGWDWTDISARWHAPAGLVITYGRRENATTADAMDAQLTLKNADGQVTPDDPRSQYWPHVDEGLPIWIRVDPLLPGGQRLDLVGFVAALTPQWPEGSARQSLVHVTVGGVFRQTGRGRTTVLNSAAFRAIMSHGPVAYWPLTDGPGTRGAVPAVGGQLLAPWLPNDPDSQPGWAQGDLGHHMPPVVALEGRSLTAGVSMASAPGAWAMDWAVRWRDTDSGSVQSSTVWMYGNEPTEDGKRPVWTVNLTRGSVERARVYLDQIPDEPTVTPIGEEDLVLDTSLHHVRFAVEDNAGDVDWALWVDGQVVSSGTESALDLRGLGRIMMSASGGDKDIPLAVGDIAVWEGSPPPAADILDAVRGYDGEPAGVRFLRLCAEQGIPAGVVGAETVTEPMGPQPPGRLLDLLRQCEASDDGILVESGSAFTYRTRVSRYNQTPALVVDAGQRQLGLPFRPVRDDQRIRNRWTVSRLGGGQYTADDEADQDKRGIHYASTEVNIFTDDRLDDHAHWRLAQGLTPGMRHPTLTLHHHSAPGLLADVLDAQIGDRVQVTGLPPQYPPGGLDQVIEGGQHVISTRTWTTRLIMGPGEPWTVGVYAPESGPADPDAPCRYDTTMCVTTADFDAGTDTSLLVETTGLPWTTRSDVMPLDIRVAGVRLRVTAISAPTGIAQTMTVTATPVNGVTKTIPSGSQVRLWQPARYAL